MYENLITEKKNHTLVIMLNRPEVLNALSRKLLEELAAAIEDLKNDPDIRGAVIIGAGDKAFAAGADIARLSELSAEETLETSKFGQQVFASIENCPKPVIAAINGFALGGGCELAMACHMRIASEKAKFGQPEVKLGLIAGYGGTQRLPRIIGPAKATELLITGEMISAEEALTLGLVNYVVAPGKLADQCLEILRKAYQQSPLAIALTLDAIAAGVNGKNGFEREMQNFGKAAASADGKEGTKAFLEKRKPKFTGK